MATLFQIGEDLLRILQTIQDGGEVDPLVDEWFTRLADAEGEKIDAYIGLLRTLDGEMTVAKAEADQFLAKARARENKGKHLRQRLKEHLERTGRDRVTSAVGRVVRLQSNGGVPALKIDPAAVVPHEFMKVRTVVEPDHDKIRQALLNGETLDFATLAPVGTHLRIC